MSLRLHATTVTDLGLHRDNNEDVGYAGRRLLVVADGVGGQPAGEVASGLMVSALEPLDAAPSDEPLAALRDAVLAGNRRIGEAATDAGHDGMATTVTALLLAGERIALVHVGDSRAYRLRDGELTRLTTDHTYVQWLVDRGVLAVEDVPHHPRRSAVTQAVRGGPLEPQAEVFPVRPGERFLLCSDGLSDVVGDADIRDALAGHTDPAECAARLVKLALAAGGPDNITVAVADVQVADVQVADVQEA